MKPNEKIQQINLSELKPFNNHPFKIRQDDEMEQITESIKEYGVITPALARPMPEAGYELISGHRRMEACKMLGIDTMPVMVREMNDIEAVITMADSNLQRENVLPSEKAFAYKMKMDAQNRQGQRTDLTSCQAGTKLESENSKRQIYRYIRLTELIPEILQMVDENKIAFTPAVELSYLSADEQYNLLDSMQRNDCTPSHAQAIQLKKLSQDGLLTKDKINDILSELKPNQQEQYKFKRDEIRKYFPKSYSDKQVYDSVFKALELLKRQRERNRDSR
ncbi:MAG TPA: ParB/RepB/Spo0J family partition protein [Clostridia bacterium]|nr:ParB/RepB/Spo0J family partition protein [Clostridia bacterium]